VIQALLVILTCAFLALDHSISLVPVAPDVRLEVLDWGGSGPPMVFLAGFGDTGHEFDGFAPQFTDSYHVLAITRREFGASSHPGTGYETATLAHDILAVLDSLHVRQATFVAHSFGGSELNYLGANHADRVARLIYLDASYDFAQLFVDSSWKRAFPVPRPAFPRNQTPADIRSWFGLVVGPDVPEHELNHLVSAGAPNISAFERGTAATDLRRITRPVLAIWATPRNITDHFPYVASMTDAERHRLEESFNLQMAVRDRHLAAFRTQVPSAEIVLVPGARHYVFLTHRNEVRDAMRLWLRPAR
jgi:non-heme chloroperoxidase